MLSTHAQQSRPREHWQHAGGLRLGSQLPRRETVNRAHPGRARYREVKGMTHGLPVEKKFQAEMVTIILSWAKEQLAAGKTGTPSSERSLPISD